MFGRMIEHMKQFFTIVGMVTLSLGGLGVMNIMLVAVRERTREIGVRKALGATTGNVQRQFFLEGFILTMLSGAIGFGVALGLCAAREPAADADAVLGHDPHAVGRPGRRGGAHRGGRDHLHVSGAPGGAAAAGRGAAVRGQ